MCLYIEVFRSLLSWTLGHFINKIFVLSAMVSHINQTMQTIFRALRKAGMLRDTIIVFASDNGGQPVAGAANNLPLRGGKSSWFEGGIRVPAFIYSKLFNNQLQSVTDW